MGFYFLPPVIKEFLLSFWRPELPPVGGAVLLLWLILRKRLGDGGRVTLGQTVAFFLLCLGSLLVAAALDVAGWDAVAEASAHLSLFGLGVALIRLSGLLVFRVLMPGLRLQLPRLLEDITVIAAYGVWAVVCLRRVGVDVSNIFATSAVITAILAFAMQDTLGNILGGLAVNLDHSLEIGDWVVLEGVSGRVTDIRWRYTKLVTRNGEKVVVPNSLLMKNRFSVVGRDGEHGNGWRRWVWFSVGLEHPAHRVCDLVQQVLADAEIGHLARQPAAQVLLMDFGPGYGRYAVRYWLTDPAQDDATDSDVRMHVVSALERAGMSLALPEEVRHTVEENQAHGALLAERELQRRREALATVDLFRHLTEEETRILAAHLVHAPFARGDVMTRQGATAHWLYILIAGSAEVWWETPEGERHRLAALGEGDVFGEMGLMTGEPRRFTVTAATDVDCYRLDKIGLGSILQARPAIAEEISRVLARREKELEAMQAASASHSPPDRALPHETLLQRMREFFKLPT